MPDYRTTFGRAVLGIVAGALAGGLITAVASVGSLNGFWEVRTAGVLFVLWYGSLVWLAALVCFSIVPWIVLDRYGYRDWASAVALGAVLSFLISFALIADPFGWFGQAGVSQSDADGPLRIEGRLTLHGWLSAVFFAAIVAIAGAAVGFVTWRTAYRAQP